MLSQLAFGWGELGHQVIARVAARLIASHPRIVAERKKLVKKNDRNELARLDAFVAAFARNRLQTAQLGDIPDVYWRSLGDANEETARKLGDATHYLNLDALLPPKGLNVPFKATLPVDYEAAKKFIHKKDPDLHFFHGAGSLPWRAQQFANLYFWALQNHKPCDDKKADPKSWKTALTYAGLLTHYVGDAAMPFHASQDYDGFLSGQGGIHAYFETDLVNALEWGLDEKVFKRAVYFLTSEPDITPSVAYFRQLVDRHYAEADKSQEVAALTLALTAESLTHIPSVRETDVKYAIASMAEAQKLPDCQKLTVYQALKHKLETDADPDMQILIPKTRILSRLDKGDEPACRRAPATHVGQDGKPKESPEARTVAEWHETLITDRLAIATALIADIWVDLWIQAKRPALCSGETTALRPAFISPTDPQCFGYALREDARDFTKKTGGTALPWPKSAKTTSQCLVE
jgi:hypothetical protein